MNEDQINKGQHAPIVEITTLSEDLLPREAKLKEGRSPSTKEQSPTKIDSSKECQEDYKIEYEFKIEGMTCVACSGAIERGMKNEFSDKGLVFDDKTKTHAVSVILLMHKMKITFHKGKAEQSKVTPSKIADEVEDLGFGAELINTTELRKPAKN